MAGFVDACYEYALAYAGPGVLPRPCRDPGWGADWETLPWSASQTMEFCYLNPGMDPARYRLLAYETAPRPRRPSGPDGTGDDINLTAGQARAPVLPANGPDTTKARERARRKAQAVKGPWPPMPHRVSPTERIHGHIDELFASGRQLPEILEDVARLGAQLLMQAALEAEITEFLGRDRYQRAAACDDARPGSRNGYREVTVKTTAGPVQLARPKLRGTSEAFASRLFGSHVTKTNALESLVIASFVRGLSVRDVEAALAEALGDQAAISKSTVSSTAIDPGAQNWLIVRHEVARVE